MLNKIMLSDDNVEIKESFKVHKMSRKPYLPDNQINIILKEEVKFLPKSLDPLVDWTQKKKKEIIKTMNLYILK